jgi:aspartyl-tRNA(Asn)/glutamyl-tRNA(Gln) amidotransferase subunit B
MSSQWEVVIGLEIHAQLAAKSKIFSGASTLYGGEPNTQACLVDLGYPGTLPVLNQKAIEMAIRFGLAVGAEISTRSIFARKNYFYPDLPKGYQISQLDLPIVVGGQMSILNNDGEERIIGITRAHLEEDAGKSIHEGFDDSSGIDLNRAGTPLLEIVSEPDISSASEAVAYMKKIHSIVRYLGICDGNMQEGSFRCDANVSIKPFSQDELGTRTELKNLNSFKFVEKAIQHEVMRQIEVIEDGGEIVQETRLYDSDLDETRPMRSKEEANDYRYFPDPDLLPVIIEKDYINEIKASLPELPAAKKERFIASYKLKSTDAEVLTASKQLADFYEAVEKIANTKSQITANWVIGEYTAALNRDDIEIKDAKLSADDLAGLLNKIADQTISGKIAKEVFESMWKGEGSAKEIIEKKGLVQITDDSELENVVNQVMENNPSQVREYLGGKDQLLGYFVGQVMKETKGKANPKKVNDILKKKLK